MLAGGLGARLGLRSVRRAMAWSSWRAFWKSPRQSRATPSLASRNAVSAGVWSSAITTRFGGGRPASERHSALRSTPSSVQWMVGREEESRHIYIEEAWATSAGNLKCADYSS